MDVNVKVPPTWLTRTPRYYGWQHGPCVLALALLLSQIPPAHIDDQVIAPLQSATEIPYYVGPGLPARILQPSTLRRKTLAVMATR